MRMKLNNKAHVHLLIRKKCMQLELLTNMKLITNLSEGFVEIRFMNTLGYVVIDFRKETCFTLSHKITPVELQLVQDIMIYCNWLEIGEKINEIKKTSRRN